METRRRERLFWGAALGLAVIVILLLGLRLSRCRDTEREDKPVKSDPFATPFAVVLDQKECLDLELDLSNHNDRWRRVPRSGPTNQAKAVRGAGRDPSAGFCVYRWNGDRLPTIDDFNRINAVPDSPALGATSDGAGAPTPLGRGNNPTTAAKVFAARARGMDEEAWNQFYDEHLKASVKPVKVAVVDASPKGILSPDRSGHGFSVSRVIADLFCRSVNGADCSQRVLPYLALPIIGEKPGDFTEDLVDGGRVGAFFHLHDALQAALDAWDSVQTNLVINLSIGWDPIKIDYQDPKLAEIRKLLGVASCRGALVVTAAGNFSGSDGPIYPAAFEALPAPTPAECTALGYPRPAPPAPPAGAAKEVPLPSAEDCKGPSEGAGDGDKRYTPLVFAVGAVDALDRRLMVDRRWGQPRLAALGVAVPTPILPGQEPALLRNGTSMSAAIVSGIAAALWQARPELDAAAVMELVYRGGVALDGGTRSKRAETEFCLCKPDGPCLGNDRKVHRVSLCGALASAFPNAGVTCYGPPAPFGDETIAKRSGLGKKLSGGLNFPCRIANCGLPLYPPPGQAPYELFPHSDGVAGCPGCKFKPNQQFDFFYTFKLRGTPILTNLSLPNAVIQSAVLRIEGQSWTISPVAFGTNFLEDVEYFGTASSEDQVRGAITFNSRLFPSTWTDDVELTLDTSP